MSANFKLSDLRFDSPDKVEVVAVREEGAETMEAPAFPPELVFSMSDDAGMYAAGTEVRQSVEHLLPGQPQTFQCSLWDLTNVPARYMVTARLGNEETQAMFFVTLSEDGAWTDE